MKNRNSKRNKVSYYVGWGTVAGAILGITCGAGIGEAYGKKVR